MRNPPDPPFSFLGPLINIATILMGVIAAYFLTIQSLKIELAAKAENAMVDALDKRMNRLEVILTEGVVSREQFYQFARDTEARLARIEMHLTQQPGEKHGKD